MHKAGSGNQAGARYCAWEHPVAAGGNEFSINVNIYDTAGLDQLSTIGFSITNYPLGRHQGRLVRDTVGDVCAVSIGVSATSRVDVVGIPPGGKGVDVGCQLAELAAPSVEQKLPVGG
jgi:hypothetical protein